MSKQGLELIINRNQFYWESTRRLELAIFLLMILILLLIGFVLYQGSTYPGNKYIVTTPDGRPITIIPLNVPLQTNENVVAWAEKAVLFIYSFDFVNYRKTLQEAQVYFTPDGYQAFKAAYEVSNNLQAVRVNRQVVSVEITGDATLQRQGQITSDVPYSWNLQVPVIVTYQNSNNEVVKQVGNILMRVDRATTIVYPEGLAIAQMILQAQ